jgi:hypothetical protein
MIRIVTLLFSLLLPGDARAQDRFITLSSTTSTQDILPRLAEEKSFIYQRLPLRCASAAAKARTTAPLFGR